MKKITTPQDGRVVMHPKSVNDKEMYFPSPFFVYHLKLKSASITLHDTTMVYPLPLLFFGESLRFYIEGGKEKVAIGKHLHVRCKESIASIVMVSFDGQSLLCLLTPEILFFFHRNFFLQDLRERMDRLLEYRASHPDIIPWENKKDPHTTLLRYVQCNIQIFCSSSNSLSNPQCNHERRALLMQSCIELTIYHKKI